MADPGPPAAALCLHGAGGGGWEWAVWRRVLAAGRTAVHAPDLVPAPGGLAATGYDDYLAQARAALAALPRPRALVGASLGGLLAAECAADADALVLVNPLPPAPWHATLPERDDGAVVHWRRDARLAGTRAALPDADDAAALFAFRAWRDESGAVLAAARAGRRLQAPACRTLCIATLGDDDVPAATTAALAAAWNADCWTLPGASHAGPLLGRGAAGLASRVAGWLSAA